MKLKKGRFSDFDVIEICAYEPQKDYEQETPNRMESQNSENQFHKSKQKIEKKTIQRLAQYSNINVNTRIQIKCRFT